MQRHVYAEGPLVPGVDVRIVVDLLKATFGNNGAWVRKVQPEGILQVWFDAEDVDSKRLQRFRVGDFRFDYLDVT
jgi:hypothetical protein